MKKLLSIMAIMAVVFAFTACGGGNTPKDVADKAMKALQEKNYDEFVKYVYVTPKEGEDPEATRKTLSGLMQGKADKEYAKKGGFKSYEIISETIDPEGSKAVVKVKMEYGNGEAEEEDYPMLKDEQGNWMLDAGK